MASATPPKPANQGGNTSAPTQKPARSGSPSDTSAAPANPQHYRGYARSGIGGGAMNGSGNKVPRTGM